MFNVLERLQELREARGLSVYKLAKLSDIPQSTIATWYQKNLLPPVDKLEGCSLYHRSFFKVTFTSWELAHPASSSCRRLPVQHRINIGC